MNKLELEARFTVHISIMVHIHKKCYSNSTVLLHYLIGTNDVQHYFMLQDLSYLPGGFTMFLPVYCPFVAAVIIRMVIMLIYTSIWSYKTHGEFLSASLGVQAE